MGLIDYMENDKQSFMLYMTRLSKDMLMEHIEYLRGFRGRHQREINRHVDDDDAFVLNARFEYIGSHFSFVNDMLLVIQDKNLATLRDQAEDMLNKSREYHQNTLMRNRRIINVKPPCKTRQSV